MQIGSLAFNLPIVLAPMEDVTDRAFRLMCRRFGADLVYTEFVNCDNLVRQIRADVAKLRFADEERPIGIQIYGNQPEVMVEAAKLAQQAGPDLLDINFGCPTKSVAGRGAGAGLLCQPELMEEITRAVVQAVDIPVTAKTRIGWNEQQINIVSIARMLENCGIQALTIHGRTRAQKFQGRADWEWIGRARAAVGIPVLGNGDVCTPQDVSAILAATGCAGVMIGRGAIGKPWLFRQARHYLATGELLPEPPLAERLEILLEHMSLSITFKGPRQGILEMGKHYNNYLAGLEGLRELKTELRQMSSYQEIRARLMGLVRAYAA